MHARFYRVVGDTGYFQDTLTRDPIVFDGIDTVVLPLGHSAANSLGIELGDAPFFVESSGDCLTPRIAEQASIPARSTSRKFP